MSKLHLPDRQKPYIMAHRGNRVLFPENTLPAFQQAVVEGADIVETDLQLTSDGHFLCIHDATLDRTTDGTGLVSEHTLEQNRCYNAAATRPDLAFEPIPTIAELASAIPDTVWVALELKTGAFIEHETCRRLSEELFREALHARTVILSFSRERLNAVRSVDPSLPIGWITTNRPWPHSRMEMFGPSWPLLLANPYLTVIAHIMGQLICPLDPVPDSRLTLYRWLGCDAVLSDNPGQTATALGR